MKTRIVFDPYVYVAAALVPDGGNAWLNMALDPTNAFVVYASEEIILAVAETLIEKFGFSKEAVQDFAHHISACTEKVEVSITGTAENAVLVCAESVRANLIIAADPQMLRRHSHKGIGIYSPDDMKRLFPPNPSLES